MPIRNITPNLEYFGRLGGVPYSRGLVDHVNLQLPQIEILLLRQHHFAFIFLSHLEPADQQLQQCSIQCNTPGCWADARACANRPQVKF